MTASHQIIRLKDSFDLENGDSIEDHLEVVMAGQLSSGDSLVHYDESDRPILMTVDTVTKLDAHEGYISPWVEADAHGNRLFVAGDHGGIVVSSHVGDALTTKAQEAFYAATPEYIQHEVTIQGLTEIAQGLKTLFNKLPSPFTSRPSETPLQ